MLFIQASRRPPVLPCCPCWSRLWLLLPTVRGSSASPGALHNTPGQRLVQATDEASWPASLLILSLAPQPDHCSPGGEKKGLIILSLRHLSRPGDFLPLLSSSSNSYGWSKIYRKPCCLLEQGSANIFWEGPECNYFRVYEFVTCSFLF